MNTYQVVLTKSYIIHVEALSEQEAGRCAELYTGDIVDISTAQDQRDHNFQINEITCGLNEAFEVNTVRVD